ncbi:MAG: glycosyltransferase family 39 protein [Myxococcaceae bacterium]
MRWAPWTLAVLMLGLWRLTAHGIWLDESVSVTYALRPLKTIGHDHNMVLYYLILKGWLALGQGHELGWVRSLSVLLAAGAIPLLHDLADRLFGAEVARRAAALMALNAFLLHYAREARAYTLVVLLAVAATWALVRWVQERRGRWAALYVLLAGLSVYAHLFAILVPLSHLVWLVGISHGRGPSWRAIVAMFASVGVLAAPWILAALVVGDGQIGWIRAPTGKSVVRTWALLSGGNLGLGVMSLIALAALALGRGAPPRAVDERARSLVLAWALGPTTVMLVIAVLWKPIVHPRYLLMALPGFSLALAVVFTHRVGWLGLLALSGLSFAAATRQGPQEAWRNVVHRIQAEAQPGDAVSLDILQPAPLFYSVDEAGAERMPPLVLPGEPWRFPRAPAADTDEDALDSHPGRVWLVQNRSESKAVAARLQASRPRLAEARYVPGDNDGLFESPENRTIVLTLWGPTKR